MKKMDKISKVLILFKDSSFFNDIINTILKLIFDQNNEELQIKFLENFHKIIQNLKTSFLNKSIFPRFYKLIELNQDNQIIETIINNLHKTFKNQLAINNDEFFLTIFIHFDAFEDYLHTKNDPKLYLNYLKCFEDFQKLIKYLTIMNNNEYFNKLKHFLLSNCRNEHCEVQRKSIKLIVLFVKYSSLNYSNELLKIFQKDYLESEVFYIRRIYFLFYEELFNQMSFNFLKENELIDNILKLFDDNTLLISKLLKHLIQLYPLLESDNRLKFILLNKLEALRKRINNEDLKDFELERSLKKFDDWHKYFITEGKYSKENQILISIQKIRNEEEIILLKEKENEVKKKKSEDDLSKKFGSKKKFTTVFILFKIKKISNTNVPYILNSMSTKIGLVLEKEKQSNSNSYKSVKQ
jgi:hypothetical protein